MSDDPQAQLPDAATVIDAFGGIRPMAHTLDIPVTTVQGWKQRGKIPNNRVVAILSAAREHDVDLSGAAEAAPGMGATMTGTSTATPDPAAPPPARRGGGFALVLSFVALLAAAGVGGWVWWTIYEGRPAGTAMEARLAAIEGKLAGADGGDSGAAGRQQLAAEIAGIQHQLEQLSGQPDMVPVLAGRLDQLADKLAELEIAAATPDEVLGARLAALESALAQAHEEAAAAQQAAQQAVDGAQAALATRDAQIVALQQRIDELTGRVFAARRTPAAEVGLALAVGQLQRAFAGGEPYAVAVATIRTLGIDDTRIAAALPVLAVRAESGMPTRADLRRRFPAMAQAVLAADAGTAENWGDWALRRVRDVVSVRRVGEDVPGDTVEARLARAEAHLDAADWNAVVAELAALDGSAATVAAPWLDDARIRLAGEAALRDLEAAAIISLPATDDGK